MPSVDVHIPTWRVEDGPSGWDLYDADDELIEWDERVDGGDTRFTSFRTWPNLNGAYISLSLTRAKEESLLSRTHNMAVTDIACQVCHAETTQAIGQVLQLNSDGTATSESLDRIKSRVQSALRRALLQDNDKGPRCSPVS